MQKKWLTSLKITFVATYIALTYGLQVALAPIPNVETVTLLLIIAAVQLPLGLSLLVSLGFTGLEVITYGFGQWALFYLVAWSILVLLAVLFRKLILKWWGFAVILGSVFGFCFGTIDALIKGLLYGFSGLLAYWFSGLLFDLIHGLANFLIILFCYLPITKIVNVYASKFFDYHNSKPTFWRIPQTIKIWCKLL